MQAIESQPDFNYEQQIFIESIVSMIAVTCDKMPEIMSPHITQIMEYFVLIIKRTYQLEEHGLFGTTINSLMDFVQEFYEPMGAAVA